MYCETREDLIRAGLLRPSTVLHDMYIDNVVAPSPEQPWHQDDRCLRLDPVGRMWADVDVQMTVVEDYRGFPPSQAAARVCLYGS